MLASTTSPRTTTCLTWFSRMISTGPVAFTTSATSRIRRWPPWAHISGKSMIASREVNSASGITTRIS